MAIDRNSSDELGDVILINASVAIDGIVELNSYLSDTENENDDSFFYKEFRYSLDQGNNYTAWQELTQPNIDAIEFVAEQGILIEYRYTHSGTIPGDLSFNSVTLLGTYRRSFLEAIKRMHFRFYPTGRAFRIPYQGIRYKVNCALSRSEDRAVTSAYSVLDQILPDNEGFTVEDAENWERRLGIPDGTGLTLEVRKQNIERKIQFPGTVKARQHYLYIQSQLRAAGFDVYVHENRFPAGGGQFESLPYSQVAGVTGNAVHSPLIQHGQIQHGQGAQRMVVNSVDRATDQTFNINDNLERTFFIGGQVVGTKADVDADREKEFRQLILRLKPVHTVGFLLINYV